MKKRADTSRQSVIYVLSELSEFDSRMIRVSAWDRFDNYENIYFWYYVQFVINNCSYILYFYILNFSHDTKVKATCHVLETRGGVGSGRTTACFSCVFVFNRSLDFFTFFLLSSELELLLLLVLLLVFVLFSFLDACCAMRFLTSWRVFLYKMQKRD